jgi:hypothetical protein
MREWTRAWIWATPGLAILAAELVAGGCGGNVQGQDGGPRTEDASQPFDASMAGDKSVGDDQTTGAQDRTTPQADQAAPSDRTVPTTDRVTPPDTSPLTDVAPPVDAGIPSDGSTEQAPTNPYDGPSYDDAPNFYDASYHDVTVYIPIDAACNPTNCAAGCCDDNYTGWCVAQPNPGSCGTGGVTCLWCDPWQGYSCQGGLCVRPQPNCGPSTCYGGCCTDPNTCSSGAPGACAMHGGPCQPCDLDSGQICYSDGGGCGPPPPPPCGANCTGCCYTNFGAANICAVGNQDVACGANGGPCHNCGYQNAHCTAGFCAMP